MSIETKQGEEKAIPMIRQNTKPRYWTSKFWTDKTVKDLISEVIKPEDIDMSSIKMNDDLNPELWDKDSKMKDVIRQTLLKIAVEFIKYCKIEDKKFSNILMVGSSANYNYTPHSDIDLHILFDFNEIDADPEIIGEFFKVKKELWSLEHEIKIDDHTVECYVQDTNEKNVSSGVYSVMKNDWIRKPMKKFISVDEPDVQMKVSDIVNKIDILVDDFNKGEDVTEKAKVVKDRIKKMRQSGLYKEGEYSPENLTFKILRNSGYLDKLSKLKNDSFDKKLSIKEPKMEI
jgi:predicted nucleotidyltransferase